MTLVGARMTDPAAFAADSAAGKLLGLFGGALRRATFSWRVAKRAHDDARTEGYNVSLKALRLVTRQEIVKSALRSQDPADVGATKELLRKVVAKNTNGTCLSPDDLFSLLRTAYLGASEQVDRDLAIRVEMGAGFDATISTGSSRESLWRANLAKIPPPYALDLQELRAQYGDGIDRLLQELVHTSNRAETLRSWALSRPNWLPRGGSVLGWLGEFSEDVDARDAALTWFIAAVAEGAMPLAYWVVRRTLADSRMSDEEKLSLMTAFSDNPLVSAVSTGNREDRLEQVRSWTSESAVQSNFRATLISRFLVDLVRFDEAIAFGENEFNERSFHGAGIYAVEAYLRRSSYRAGNHAADVNAGLALALLIRDKRRNWGVSSGLATAKAARAAIMLTDPERAIALTQPPEATHLEADYPEVRNEAVLALLLVGDLTSAGEMVNQQTPSWIRLQIESQNADLTDDRDTANALLSRAIDSVDEWSEKARLSLRLASRGLVHPFVKLLREDNPEIAEEIELVAALNAQAPGAEDRARARVLARPALAFPLFELFEAAGRRRDVIFVAEQVAQTWSDPEMWLKAARVLLVEGEYAKASDRATKALDVGGESWGNKAGAYQVQIEAATSTGDLASALHSARAYVRLRPDSAAARWILIRVQRMSGDLDQAYLDWRDGGSPPPSTEIEALIWLELFRLHGSGVSTLQGFEKVVDQFASSKQVRNIALGALTFAPLTEERGLLNVSSLLERFEREYPEEKHAIWRITIDSEHPSQILSELDAAVAPRQEQFAAIDEGVRNGTIPIGLAANPAGKHVAEVLNLRHKAPRYAGSPQLSAEFDAVQRGISVGVAADVTALFTLSLLTEPHGNLLVAKFPRVVGTSEQMLDASAAREKFGRGAGGVFYPSSESQNASFKEDDPIERAVQAQNVERLIGWFRRTERLSGLPLSTAIAKRLSDGDDVWLATLDLAARMDIPVWCDDRATRIVAAEAGARSFGTPALVEFLRTSAQLSNEVADDLDADLVHNWNVGLVYRESAFVKARALDQFAPQGTAAAILHSGAEHGREKIEFMASAMSALTSTPDQVAEWASVAFRYLGDVWGSAEDSFDSQAELLSALMLQLWMTPSCLVFIANAGRAELGAQWSVIFQSGFRRMFVQKVGHTDRSTASQYALALSAELGTVERQLALEVVMSR
jgi:tetratricopeptide (TPR) repeat protein